MTPVRLLAEARKDLDEIWSFVAADSVEQADRLVTRLLDVCDSTLATFPQSGRPRPELDVGLGSLSVGNYVVFYRFTEDAVQVVRILHGARDLSPLFR